MGKLSVFAAFLAVVLLMSGVLSQDSQKLRKGQSGGGKDGDDDDEVWLIHQGIIGSRENYLDPISGTKKGFEVDILNAVCEIAGKNCEIVEDQFVNCWNGDGPVGGAGLFNFYYDGCLGWNPTYTRARTFRFSDPFVKNRGSVFLVPTGNPGGFDWTDITGKTIGFVDGFVSSPACILRTSDDINGAELSVDQIVYYPDPESLAAGVISGEVDAGLDSVIDYPEGIEVGSETILCALGGNALMTRKDSDMIDWWNPAFAELLASDQYAEICRNLITVHGFVPGPEPEDICFGF